MTYDLLIIGGGPAGAAAAVYAARKRLRALIITDTFGGQSVVSEKIENWVGTPSISGIELAENLKKHVETYAGELLTIKEGVRIKSVSKDGDIFKAVSENDEVYLGKSVLIVTGSSRRKLQAENADALEHKGLTYCASCDGPMFSGEDVIVVGGGNAGFESASQLLAYCKSVTLLNHSEGFSKADPGTVERVLSHKNMKAIDMADVTLVKGDGFVSGLVYKDNRTGEKHELSVKGIFVEIGQIPNSGPVKELVDIDAYGRIKIDPRTQATSVSGIWAAGDVTDVLYHQNNIAAGDAVRALENIYLHLNTK